MSWLFDIVGPKESAVASAAPGSDETDNVEDEDGDTSDSDSDSDHSPRDESNPSSHSTSSSSDDDEEDESEGDSTESDDNKEEEDSVATIDHVKESVEAAHFEIGQLGNNLHSRIDDLETAVESLTEAIESLSTTVHARNHVQQQQQQQRLANEREQMEMDRAFARDARSHFIAMLAREDNAQYFLMNPDALKILKQVMFLNSL